MVGQARLTDATLLLETNSRKRADALRKRVEAACGEQIRYCIRVHTDPRSPKVAPDERGAPLVPPSAEEEQFLLELKQRHYAGLPDEPLPALAGKTPRAAVRTAQGRIDVDVLLKDMENHEQRSADGATFDFCEIRRQLGLD